MQVRAHRTRLEEELRAVRDELLVSAHRIPSDRFDWAPQAGMKSFREQLREVGTMEKIVVEFIKSGKETEWGEAVQWTGHDLDSTLSELKSIRAATLALLWSTPEDKLQEPVHALWGKVPSGPHAEREGLFRWIARHEYYHIGQIVTYLWILGDNPYRRSAS